MARLRSSSDASVGLFCLAMKFFSLFENLFMIPRSDQLVKLANRQERTVLAPRMGLNWLIVGRTDDVLSPRGRGLGWRVFATVGQRDARSVADVAGLYP